MLTISNFYIKCSISFLRINSSAETDFYFNIYLFAYFLLSILTYGVNGGFVFYDKVGFTTGEYVVIFNCSFFTVFICDN